jgi:hypothetical protein
VAAASKPAIWEIGFLARQLNLQMKNAMAKIMTVTARSTSSLIACAQLMTLAICSHVQNHRSFVGKGSRPVSALILDAQK